MKFFNKMYAHFVPSIVQRGGDDKRIDPSLQDLNIMPDASPSTPFGEKWLENLFVRAEREHTGVEERPVVRGVYRGVSYEGVFGETERWLWAANDLTRCIWDQFAKGDAGKQVSEPETPSFTAPSHPGEAKSVGSMAVIAEPASGPTASAKPRAPSPKSARANPARSVAPRRKGGTPPPEGDA